MFYQILYKLIFPDVCIPARAMFHVNCEPIMNVIKYNNDRLDNPRERIFYLAEERMAVYYVIPFS